ncbi:MAG: carboxylating nicotinate-nucleotide diphosphorylase [Bacteroidota bacterium]|jgi:nicotinate-nucleotide pyrophosphorylase (carboxylating)
MTNPNRNSATDELLRSNKVSRIVEEAIIEDLGMGDITTDAIIASETMGCAEILVKESGVIAGLEVAAMAFKVVEPEMAFHSLQSEGAGVAPGTVVASVRGSLAGILKAERTALNFLQRMSGIATLTRKFVQAIEGTRARITDTRKTAPGLRVLDKLAVKLGGGVNHRFGLDDMVLIKDNHIAAAGGISPAIERCLTYLQNDVSNMRIEVETTTLEQVGDALKHNGIHRIMLDNFSPEDIKRAVQLVNSARRSSKTAGGHAIEIEVSGNISLENVRYIAETGVDFISVGKLTHSAKAIDISLEILPS